MDKPLDLGNQQALHEFTHGDSLGIADRDKGLVHVGVQLRPYILALEAHRLGGLDGRRQEAIRGVATNVVSGVVPQYTLGEQMQSPGLLRGNELTPLGDSLDADS